MKVYNKIFKMQVIQEYIFNINNIQILIELRKIVVAKMAKP